MRVCLKAGRKYAFGEAKTQLVYKICVLDEGINVQDSYGPLEVHKQKVECAFEWYSLGLAEKYQSTLDKWLQFSRGPHPSHLISLLCPLNNKFPNTSTKKSITNSQISSGKKKKSIPCMGVTDDVPREKGGKKEKEKRMTEEEPCESMECSEKNKEQKRVKEKKRKEGKKKKRVRVYF